jgi:hypothetical protein
MKAPLLLSLLAVARIAVAADWSWDPEQQKRCVRFGHEGPNPIVADLDTTDCSTTNGHYWFLTTGLENAVPNQDPRLSYTTLSDSTSPFIAKWILDTTVVPGADWNALWMLDYPIYGGSTSMWGLGNPAYFYASIRGSVQLGATNPPTAANGGRVTTEFVAQGPSPYGTRYWILGIDCHQTGWGDNRLDSALYVNTPPFDVFGVYFVHMDGRALGLSCGDQWLQLNNLNVTALFRTASEDNPGTFPEPSGGWSAATLWGYYLGVESSGYVRGEISTKNRGITDGRRPGARDGKDVGAFDPSTAIFHLRNSLSAGADDVSFQYGIPGDIPVAGDWDGDGVDTIGVFRNGTFFLRNSNSSGYADSVIYLGQAGDSPVAGDWDGDERTDVGVFRQGHWKLRLSNGAVQEFDYGATGATPIVGDWTGKGYDSVGVRSNDWMYLRNSNTAGAADIAFLYGTVAMVPFAGDWNGDGATTTGLYSNGAFYLRNSNSSGYADVSFPFGAGGYVPLAGDWDGLPSIVLR